MYNVTVVGLGLIGGSMAKAAKGFRDCRVFGIDTDESVVKKANEDGVIENSAVDTAEIISRSDLIIVALYAKATVDFIVDNQKYMKSGAVIADVCGVKCPVVYAVEPKLRSDLYFVGCHPMAGRELSGYANSIPDMFRRCNFIIASTPNTKRAGVETLEEFARHIGAANIINTSPEDHDEMIAYTSQLMHVVAVALCDNAHIEKSAMYSAGSLRDCTRVAILNEELWSELFVLNKEPLVKLIDEMCQSLTRIKEGIVNDDKDGLKDIMRHATAAKRRFLNN
ncbi:MAG: prephenate dehydrogenase [Clostridia bacterium]